MADEASGGPRRAVPLDRVRAARGEARVAVPRNKLAGTRAFRRMRADRAFGIIGVLLVVFALVLVFRWEKTVPPEPSYGIDWPTFTVNLTDAQTYELAPGENQLTNAPPPPPLTFEIPDANVTKVGLKVSWSDDVGDTADEWDILWFNLTGPSSPETHVRIGATGGTWATGTEKTVQEEKSVVPVPSVRSAPVRTEAEARASIGDTYTNRTGTGAWALTLSLKDALDDWKENSEPVRQQRNGECPPPGDEKICIPDDGEAVKVTVYYEYYRAVYRAPSPSS